MRKIRLAGALVAASVLATAPLQAAEVAGVRIEEQTKSGTTDLVLNGAGIRTRIVFKVYVGALYVPKKTGNAATIIEAKEPRRVVLHLLRDLDADSLFGALLDGLKKNHGDAEMAALKPDIDQFERIMRGIGNAKTGDVIGIDFTPSGVAIAHNGQARGSVAGENFGRALLKVWLGDKPADADLKRAMLGG
jgi:long-chain acyl-CoA synthetase